MTTLLLALLIVQSADTQSEWTFEVRHDHAFGSCTGRLTITDEVIRYETSEGDHSREWSYPDVESFEIVSTDELRIRTYDSGGLLRVWKDETFSFRLESASLDGDFFAFLEAHSLRPVRTRVVPDSATLGSTGDIPLTASFRILQEVPVRHDHLFGGCQGMLEISEDRIVYRTENPDDSRVWRLADVESFGSTGDFDLRISTRTDTFHFDLKLPLSPQTYRHIWEKVHEPDIQTYRRRGQ